VPLASVALENVAIRYVRGIHSGLTNVPAVYNDVFHWLNEQSLDLPDTADGALSQHLGPGEMESEGWDSQNDANSRRCRCLGYCDARPLTSSGFRREACSRSNPGVHQGSPIVVQAGINSCGTSEARSEQMERKLAPRLRRGVPRKYVRNL
jgi:hypothetical protein